MRTLPVRKVSNGPPPRPTGIASILPPFQVSWSGSTLSTFGQISEHSAPARATRPHKRHVCDCTGETVP